MRTSFAFIVLSLGIAAAATTTTATDHAAVVVDETPTKAVDFAEFMQGILEGAIESADPIAETCFLNGEEMIRTIAEAIKDFREGTKESTEAGIQLIGTIIEEASKELVDCEEAVDDFEALVQMAKSFSQPWSFAFHAGKNIIINHVEIIDEINAAMDAWEEPDFFECGYNVGEALAQVFLLGSEEETTVSMQ
jgi:hypothetical protein